MKLPWMNKSKAEKEEKQPIVDQIMYQLQASISWKRSQGYYDDWPEYERFKRGDQWPSVTADTKYHPRPVVNIFETVIDQKVSAVLSEEPEITFLPREGMPEDEILAKIPPDVDTQTAQKLRQELAQTADDDAAQMFTKAAKFTAEEVELEDLNEEVVEAAALLGTGITYWWWDPSKRGGNPSKATAYEGDICGEEIDPADIHFGNPREKDVQKQPWIIITGRTPLEAFREFYREHAKKLGEDVNAIQGSKSQERQKVYDAERNEVEATKYVDEIRRFRKVYNEETDRVEVWYEVVAEGKLVRQERPLFQRSDLYPIAIFRWKNVRHNILGEGEGRNLIEVQKSINRLLALAIWNGYLTAWAKMRVKKGAIENKPTNTPAEIIIDQSPPGTGWGIDYMAPPQVPSYVKELIEIMPQMVKDEAGVHEAAVGKAPSSDLNAAAIMALQRAAGVRISKVSRNFRRYLRDVARIWEAFWKEFYTERRLIRITEDTGRQFFWFRGTDYADFDFDVRVTATPSAAYSEFVVLSELKEHLDKGRITFEQYLENVSKNVLPMAEKLLEAVRQAQAMGAQMAQQQAEQGGGMDINAVLAAMPPEEREAFLSQPPEVQQQLLTELQGGGAVDTQAGQPMGAV